MEASALNSTHLPTTLRGNGDDVAGKGTNGSMPTLGPRARDDLRVADATVPINTSVYHSWELTTPLRRLGRRRPSITPYHRLQHAFLHHRYIGRGRLPLTNAYWTGFNVGANNNDGSCKSTADWETAFNKLAGLPQHITSVRVYAASDCNTLANAVPAAIASGVQILVGIWAEDNTHYTNEKNALQAAINAHGSDWIIAISVGSEDLYRGDTSASTLAQQIYDVRGMVRAMGVEQQVGHVDTWTAWVDNANTEVIQASDFIGLDSYPYFQSAAIADASNTFWQSMTATRNQVNAVSPGKWVWVTETGWPVSGPNYGAAVASVQNAQTYWRSVACACFQQVHVFWYAYQDYSASPSFGVFGSNGNAIYDLYGC
ncbi:hypothetical protein LTS09_013162 [Friedmanniomyces endolithicus]|nr:hypothetical protein LTS09_013162 [Friedmanniomyces endolithicus]